MRTLSLPKLSRVSPHPFLFLVLVNLLGNAVKFSKEDEKGEVVLSAKTLFHTPTSDKVQVMISVKDQGIGIPESAKEKLFQPFNQADSSVTRKYGGSGLGWFILESSSFDRLEIYNIFLSSLASRAIN